MKYKHQPKIKEELVEAITKEIYEVQGTKDNPNWNANLNCIDTSNITDMSFLFSKGYGLENFNGNISNWNVSNVKNMTAMFKGSQFNQDISNWDVSNVKDMTGMFAYSKFNNDISKWNISNVIKINWMFAYSQFNQDISKWNVSNVKDMSWMFYNSQFNQDISKWDVSNVTDMSYMFSNSQFNQDISNWNVSNVENMNWMFENSKFNQDIGSWPLKKDTELKNISVSLKYNKLPDKIIYPETTANIFIRTLENSNNTFNIDNFKKIFKEFLNNRKELYKNKGYKSGIINKLILNDIANILKYLKDKNIQDKFMEITMNKNGKELDINIS